MIFLKFFDFGNVVDDTNLVADFEPVHFNQSLRMKSPSVAAVFELDADIPFIGDAVDYTHLTDVLSHTWIPAAVAFL